MVIRPWTVEDIPKIAELEKEIFTDAWSENEIFSTFNSGCFYNELVEKEKEVVAYIGMKYNAWEGEIYLVAVKKEYRQKGFASSLLKNAIDFCKNKNIENVFLEVRKSNTGAISLYKKFNFKVFSERKNYYGLEDGLNMVLSLR